MFFSDLCYTFCFLALITFVIFILQWRYLPHFNFRYLLKWLTFYIKLKRRQLWFKDEEILILPSFEEVQLEKPKRWKNNQKYTRDSIVICGTDCKGISLLAEVVRGKHGTATAHLWLKYKSDIFYTQGTKVHASVGWITDTLSMEQLEPMRRWRLVFNGRLRCENENNDDDLKHVRINFIWSALNAPYIYKRDADHWRLAKDLAKIDTSNWRDLLNELGDGYEQWGVLNGSINIDGIDTTHIHLNSLRQHSWSEGDFKSRQSTVAFVEDDTMISINFTQGKISTHFGHLRNASGKVSKFVVDYVQPTNEDEKQIITFSDGCGLDNTLMYECRKIKIWNSNALTVLKGLFNTLHVDGFKRSCSGTDMDDIPGLSLLCEDISNSSALILPLESIECSNSHLVGGKASSLSLLNQATAGYLKNKAIVPKGFCLTVNAMKIQLESSELIKAVLENLELVLSGTEPGNLQDYCQNVVTSWQRIPICDELLGEVTKRIKSNQTYAVRSSGIGEDSEQLSAAGQNATILGCLGVDGVLYGIKECWASLYAFQSVEYRRQHGLPVDCGMGVIVQEMVAADTAGVMFTRHPVTGDPAQVYVTANFGLGESVVSGAVEPDTFIVNKLDSLNLRIESVIKGEKGHKIRMEENGNLVTEYIKKGEELCISNKELIDLVKVGMILEEMFGWPRDIEWALHHGKIYLLQCRPITSLFAWTEEELTHELDSALLNDIFTTANTGEVYPGATSPLTQSVPIRIINKLMMREDRNTGLWYNNDLLCTTYHHAIINVLKTLFRYIKPEITLSQKVLELAICGHPVSNDNLIKKAGRKNGYMTFWKNIVLLLSNLMDMIWNSSTAKKAETLGNTIKLNFTSCISASSLIDLITSNFVHLQEAVIYHCQATAASVVWQMVLLSVLTEGNADLSRTHLEDVSQLLISSADVVSAEIPTALKEMSTIILQCFNFEEFYKIPQTEAKEWLRNNCPPAFDLLEKLLLKHGHRSIKEMDLKTETWGLKPDPLFVTLQSLVQKPIQNTKPNHNKNQDNVVDLLMSPKKKITRILLKWLQPLSKTAAERREITKNALLLVLHQFRLAYRHLGGLMHQEGRLPEANLLFYFTHYELMTYITTQDPAILQKAARRKRHWLKWSQLQFPEIMNGFPEPITIDIPKVGEGTKVEGTLVFPGQVQGRACILSLGDDTTQICPGDILITQSTDVGWSPLYPLLSGVVTELGGLISHGAVVAREYGLPCIVGAAGATNVFQTGDEVLLDANKGFVVKLSSNDSVLL